MATLLLTGATGGLGSVVHEMAVSAGWNVLAIGLEHGDIADPEVALTIANQAPEDTTAVVHLVGGIVPGKALDLSSHDDFEKMMRLNFTTTEVVLRTMIPVISRAGGGSVVTIGAKSALLPAPNRSAYSAAKAAVISLTLSVAEEGRPKNIRANCIVPSIIRTPANQEWASEEQSRLWVTPEQIAATILHLIDPTCAVSGAVIPMYGSQQ